MPARHRLCKTGCGKATKPGEATCGRCRQAAYRRRQEAAITERQLQKAAEREPPKARTKRLLADLERVERAIKDGGPGTLESLSRLRWHLLAALPDGFDLGEWRLSKIHPDAWKCAYDPELVPGRHKVTPIWPWRGERWGEQPQRTLREPVPCRSRGCRLPAALSAFCAEHNHLGPRGRVVDLRPPAPLELLVAA